MFGRASHLFRGEDNPISTLYRRSYDGNKSSVSYFSAIDGLMTFVNYNSPMLDDANISRFVSQELDSRITQVKLDSVSFNEKGYVAYDGYVLFARGFYCTLKVFVKLAFENGTLKKIDEDFKKLSMKPIDGEI